MKQVCPISADRLNEKVARSNAFITVGTLAIFFTLYYYVAVEESIYIVSILGLDFLIRGFFNSKKSPVCQISKGIVKNMPIKMINAGPKVFAAQVGFFFCLTASVLFAFDLNLAAIIATGILTFFAALEAFFGFCMACTIYPFLSNLLHKYKDYGTGI